MTKYPSQYIKCICTIEERFAPTAFHAILPNGKRSVAFIQKREEALLSQIQAGSRVLVQFSPADFDRVRILELC